MPELPEVQTVVNDLQTIVNGTITGFSSRWPKALKNKSGKSISEKEFTSYIVGKKIIAIERLGKNIFIALAGNISLFIHLRMTGQLLANFNVSNSYVKTLDAENIFTAIENKHVHHAFLINKKDILAFSDVRKFATLKILPTKDVQAFSDKLGIDPVVNFTWKKFHSLFEKKYNKSLKEFLMDQSVIVGIGNIYASEILFEAQIDPRRTVPSITENQQKKLYLATKKILKKAIALRGTSVSDYRDAKGKKGQFQDHLKVYKKVDQPCKKCATIIIRTVLGQRSSFYCPNCQK